MRINFPVVCPFFFVLFTCLFWSGVQAEPVANPPAFNHAAENAEINRADYISLIPDKEMVGIPVYPGAVWVSNFDAEGWLPSIQLVSDHDSEKVIEWYREVLQGWAWNEPMKLFYASKDEYDFSMMGQVEAVSVLDEAGAALDLAYYHVPMVKSRIQISYAPKKPPASSR